MATIELRSAGRLIQSVKSLLKILSQCKTLVLNPRRQPKQPLADAFGLLTECVDEVTKISEQFEQIRHADSGNDARKREVLRQELSSLASKLKDEQESHAATQAMLTVYSTRNNDLQEKHDKRDNEVVLLRESLENKDQDLSGFREQVAKLLEENARYRKALADIGKLDPSRLESVDLALEEESYEQMDTSSHAHADCEPMDIPQQDDTDASANRSDHGGLTSGKRLEASSSAQSEPFESKRRNALPRENSQPPPTPTKRVRQEPTQGALTTAPASHSTAPKQTSSVGGKGKPKQPPRNTLVFTSKGNLKISVLHPNSVQAMEKEGVIFLNNADFEGIAAEDLHGRAKWCADHEKPFERVAAQIGEMRRTNVMDKMFCPLCLHSVNGEKTCKIISHFNDVHWRRMLCTANECDRRKKPSEDASAWHYKKGVSGNENHNLMPLLYAWELDRNVSVEEIRHLFSSFGYVNRILLNDGKMWPRAAKECYEEWGFGAFVEVDGSENLMVHVLHNSDRNPLTNQQHSITARTPLWGARRTLHVTPLQNNLKLVTKSNGRISLVVR